MRPARSWIVWGALVAALASIAVWLYTRDRLPREIRIATAARGGLYYQLATRLGEDLLERTGVKVEVLATEGTIENHALLQSRGADFAIMQLGPAPPGGLRVVAPLYRDVVHVIVRPSAQVASLDGLAGRRILVGEAGSGMRVSAGLVLDHYGIRVEHDANTTRYFMSLEGDPEADGAIATAGFANPDLTRLLSSGDYGLLPIDQAHAIALRHPMFFPYTIPKGLYRGAPPVPAEPVETLATPTVLATAPQTSPALVTAVLDALYAGGARKVVPDLITREDATIWTLYPRHDAARAFYDPYQGLGVLANLFETLAAIKELLFALGAGLYVAVSWWRNVEQRRLERELSAQKEHLDVFIDETAAIERAQMRERDPERLAELHTKITDLKLRALAELTGEAVRGDRMFSILLSQCASVTHAIETKLDKSRTHPA